MEVKITNGVIQKCNLSPILFNLCIVETLKVMRKANIRGIRAGGISVQILDFDDDIALN